MTENQKTAYWLEIKNVVGALQQVTRLIAEHSGSIQNIEHFSSGENVRLYLEIAGVKDAEDMQADIEALDVVASIRQVPTFNEIYGKRVIVIGGGAQVAEVAKGAISEADRHNIRGEKISVDTIPLVGEQEIANAVRAVTRLPRVKVLILAGALMGGEISRAVDDVKKEGIIVISLNMAGSVPKHADLVITDPIQAGVTAVMAIADTAKFDIKMQKGRVYK
ncbi:MAG: hypothetical protein MSIBF_03235 [Candidatus Altiarchaeales archaeon IMC4]|nr:MAG: hypothetical protein MSIBF_03235 [Candidatus Altiarchaeales archaeon IMC4]